MRLFFFSPTLVVFYIAPSELSLLPRFHVSCATEPKSIFLLGGQLFIMQKHSKKEKQQLKNMI